MDINKDWRINLCLSVHAVFLLWMPPILILITARDFQFFCVSEQCQGQDHEEVRALTFLNSHFSVYWHNMQESLWFIHGLWLLKKTKVEKWRDRQYQLWTMAYLSVHWKNSSSEERWVSVDGTRFPEGLCLTCWWQLMNLPASLVPISQKLVTLDHSLRSVTDVHWPTFGVMNCIIYLHTVPQVSSLKGSGALGSLSAQRAFLNCCSWQ